MNNIELLAPAGSFEALTAAIQNGANAVYIGGSQFSARAFATNFDNEEIVKAIEYAHQHFAKLYVTVNTVYYDEEIEPLLEYIAFLYHHNCDAIIVQDIGLFSLVKDRIPGMEIHISTQMSVNNLESVKYFEQFGVERVVLARENSIEQIQEIAQNTNVDLEVFVHGAICVGYSGQCLMSSNIAKRSGNRGSCGQPCRLGYDLNKDGQKIEETAYLLSPKDLCTIEKIGELIDANVKSFKIEGRMKRPEYVATIISAYRHAIDNHLARQKSDLNDSIIAMKKMFNRGFSKGWLFNDPQRMEPEFPGNQGVEVGRVVAYNNKTRKVAIKLSDTLRQNDRVEFIDILLKRTVTKLYFNDLLVNHGSQGDIVEIELDSAVAPGSAVNKIYDVELIKTAQKSYAKENVKNNLNFTFTAHIGAKPQLTYKIGAIQGTVTSPIMVEQAQNRPVSEADIAKQLSKLGNTQFVLGELKIECDDNISLPLKVLNQLRRAAIDKINEYLVAKRNPIQLQLPELEKRDHEIAEMVVKVTNFAQLKKVLEFTRNVAYPLDATIFECFELVKDLDVNLSIYTTYRYDDKLAHQVKEHTGYQKVATVFVGDYRAMAIFNDKQQVIDSNMNIVNSFGASFFQNCTINLSTEMSRKQINRIATINDTMFQVYGRGINMITRHCLISQHYFGCKIVGCNKCKTGSFELNDRMGERFPILVNDLCDNIIYHNKPTLINDLDRLKVDKILIAFTTESDDEITKIMSYYLNLLNGGPRQELDFSNYVKLYYND